MGEILVAWWGASDILARGWRRGQLLMDPVHLIYKNIAKIYKHSPSGHSYWCESLVMSRWDVDNGNMAIDDQIALANASYCLFLRIIYYFLTGNKNIQRAKEYLFREVHFWL
jgi:hypothetical protein